MSATPACQDPLVFCSNAAVFRMKLDPVNLLPQTKLVTPGAVKAWTVGQVLAVSVIGRESENSIRLQIGGRAVLAMTTLPLQTGQELNVRVVSTAPSPVLAVIPSAATTTAARQLVNTALNETLPRQQELRTALTTLDRLVADPPAVAREPLRQVLQNVQTLRSSLPTLQEITHPQILAKTMLQSGLLLEANLKRVVTGGQTEYPPTQDLKGQLLGLAKLIGDQLSLVDTRANIPRDLPLTNAPGHLVSDRTAKTADVDDGAQVLRIAGHLLRELDEKTSSALARLEMHQLKTVHAELNDNLHASFEIPLRAQDTTESLTLQIDRDEKILTDSEQALFTVALEVPIRENENLSVRLTLQGNSVAISMWSEHEALRRAARAEQDRLREQLQQAGLSVQSVRVTSLPRLDALKNLPARLIEMTV